MALLDALIEFDAALEWPLDDPLLADEPPSDVEPDGWLAQPLSAEVA
jgi:hypothetical protein